MDNVGINISINDNAVQNKEGIKTCGQGQSVDESGVGANTSAPHDTNPSNEEMRRQMELQLHQQYAENNNANLDSTVALIVALLAVFYGYGYVYIHSTNCFCQNWSMMCGSRFTLNALLLTAVATWFVIGVLYYICFSQGIKQRMEQFITFAIRYKCYSRPKGSVPPERCDDIEDKMTDDYNRIFPKGYHPFKDSSDYCSIKYPRVLAQGLFGDLLPIISASLILILLTLVLRIVSNLNCCALHRVPVWVYIILIALLLLFLINVYCGVRKKICAYMKRAEQYSKKIEHD